MNNVLLLDVGCGQDQKGTVNCDLYVEPTDHRPQGPIDTKNVPNFVLCDAHALPFRSSVFKQVTSKSLHEHVNSPNRVLQEMIRVANGVVSFSVPHRYSRVHLHWLIHPQRERKSHQTVFGMKQLRAWLDKVVGKGKYRARVSWVDHPDYVLPSKWTNRFWILRFFHITLFRLPGKIEVTIQK